MQPVNRRSAIASAFAALAATEAEAQQNPDAPVRAKDHIKITKLETFLVKPRWLFLKVHTDAGITGLGEPITEGRALTCAEAVKEIEPYLIGKDPRRVAHHWQAIYRHAFYRGGPILTSALSGVDQAMWDIKGKALGVPVYQLLGGPTRDRVRVYAHAGTVEQMREMKQKGFTAFKTGPAKQRPARYIETPADRTVCRGEVRGAAQGDGQRRGHRRRSSRRHQPRAREDSDQGNRRYQPMFVEEPCQAQNHDVMAEIARGTFLPIATGERVFTKWGFREVLEKRAATVFAADLCHAGGITEVRLIAGIGRERTTRLSRRTIRWDRFRSRRACRWPPRFRISCARSR